MESHYTKIAKRVIELSGGKNALNAETEKALEEFNARWDQNIESMGRILRSHLVLEYYITKCLKALNPNLDNLDRARLTFNQKFELIKPYSIETEVLAVGIKRLNKIRNRLAHTLEETVNEQDAEIFLSIEYFRSLREALAKPHLPSSDSLDVLEDFAKFASQWLDSLSNPNSLSKRFEQAFSELGTET